MARAGGWRYEPAEPSRDRIAAAALALFLGSFGIHKFYLGRTFQGVFYLLFFWTGIPALIAWIEAIVYLTMSDESWALRYGGPVRRSNGAVVGCLLVVALLPLLGLAWFIGVIAVSGFLNPL